MFRVLVVHSFRICAISIEITLAWSSIINAKHTTNACADKL